MLGVGLRGGVMAEFSDQAILRSWAVNAEFWTTAIANAEIESRNLVTNRAIVRAITRYSPGSIIDIGCGEGWLCRELAARGVDATGVDGVSALVGQAKQRGPGKYAVASYEEIAAGKYCDGPYDAAVCNFSLIGKESVDQLLASLPRILVRPGLLFIQTVHPAVGCGDLPYEDGWRSGSWDGFGPKFTDPPPWYFRRLETWVRLLRSSEYSLLECQEPLDPRGKKPASIIFVARLNDAA